ncbi:MAG: alpha/beta hydrolase [Alphaproteobacteria bacterium]|nr:alpha/beta hydrolase [Alphaproteobacteria bacterium]
MMVVLKWAGVALLVYVLYVSIIVMTQRNFMYFPFGSKRPNIYLSGGMDVITVTTDDGLELEGWYDPPTEDTKPVIVMFHGNGQSIAYRPPKVQHFREQGYGALLAEYRGYGGNPGKTTEEGVYKDGRAYINWLINDQNITADNIILYGESLGSGVAVQMATEYDVKAVLLDVPFNSALAVAKSHFFVVPFLEYLMWDQYRSDLKIKNINAPVFIGLAGSDMVVRPHFGRALYELAVEPKQMKEYPDSGHMDLHHHGFPQDAVAFIEALNKEQKPEAAE